MIDFEPVEKRLARGNARYSLKNTVYNVEWDEEKHPRGEDGKFGTGGSGKKSEKKSEKKNQERLKTIQPQKEIPKPEIISKLGSSFMSYFMQDIDLWKNIDNDDELKAKGIDYIDGYHVTDMKTAEEGITGSSVDATGSTIGKIRDKATYMFFDPSDIEEGYAGIMGAKEKENTVVHVKIPVERIMELKWDSLFNVSFGTYSAGSIAGDVPPEWISGLYEYKQKNYNSCRKIKVYRVK